MKIALVVALMVTSVGCAAKKPVTAHEALPPGCILGGTVQSSCTAISDSLAVCHEVVVKYECVKAESVPAKPTSK